MGKHTITININITFDWLFKKQPIEGTYRAERYPFSRIWSMKDHHADNRPCIYKILNKENHRIYIGRAENFNQRCNQHEYQLNRGTHHNAELQRDWYRYGPCAFEFIAIEPCCNNEEAIVMERFIIHFHLRHMKLYNAAVPALIEE